MRGPVLPIHQDHLVEQRICLRNIQTLSLLSLEREKTRSNSGFAAFLTNLFLAIQGTTQPRGFRLIPLCSAACGITMIRLIPRRSSSRRCLSPDRTYTADTSNLSLLALWQCRRKSEENQAFMRIGQLELSCLTQRQECQPTDPQQETDSRKYIHTCTSLENENPHRGSARIRPTSRQRQWSTVFQTKIHEFADFEFRTVPRSVWDTSGQPQCPLPHHGFRSQPKK